MKKRLNLNIRIKVDEGKFDELIRLRMADELKKRKIGKVEVYELYINELIERDYLAKQTAGDLQEV